MTTIEQRTSCSFPAWGLFVISTLDDIFPRIGSEGILPIQSHHVDKNHDSIVKCPPIDKMPSPVIPTRTVPWICERTLNPYRARYDPTFALLIAIAAMTQAWRKKKSPYLGGTQEPPLNSYKRGCLASWKPHAQVGMAKLQASSSGCLPVNFRDLNQIRPRSSQRVTCAY